MIFVSWCFFFFSSRSRHTRLVSDWSSDVCSSDLADDQLPGLHFGEAGVALAVAEAVAAGSIGRGPWPELYLVEALSAPRLTGRDPWRRRSGIASLAVAGPARLAVLAVLWSELAIGFVHLPAGDEATALVHLQGAVFISVKSRGEPLTRLR